MQITFLIGNGFDINCGLKCTYRDVYTGYCKTESKSEVIADFKKNIDGNLDTWADFEMAMNDYMPNFKSEADFLLCARDFKLYMIEHLKREEDSFFNSPVTKLIKNRDYLLQKEMGRSLTSFYSGINHNIDSMYVGFEESPHTTFRFISFNYTRVLDNLIRKVITEPMIIHIHGLLDDDPILGIDNTEQFHKDLRYSITKRTLREFVKPYFNQEYDTSRMEDAIETVSSSDTICIFGLSLGESDLTWRKEIVEWLKRHSKHQLFLYSFECSRKKTGVVTQRMDEEDEAKLLFLDRIGVSAQDVDSIINQVHIPIGRNLFNIKMVLNDAIEEIVRINKEAKEKAEDNRKRSVGSVRGIGA